MPPWTGGKTPFACKAVLKRGRRRRVAGMEGKVLIVDDEADVRESTALLVESLGYEAIRLDAADDVLAAVRAHRPDVVLHDVRMPGVNLAGLMASMRSDPMTAEVPVVLFGASRDVAAIAARHHAWGYLTKPFMKGELTRLLAQVFAPHGDHMVERDFQREVGSLFTEIWDLVTAVNNYVRVLELQRDLPESAHRPVRGLAETLLKLETRMTRMRTYVSGLIASMEPVRAEASRGNGEPVERTSRPAAGNKRPSRS